MAHVFISYSKEDAGRAQVLADLLRKNGWPVWWDPHIPVGETWADVIEQKLLDASCVIALWSKHSVGSRWVKKEARFALTDRRLIPALIDDVRIPFEFADIETAMLTDWPNEDNPELAMLLDRVRELAGDPAPPTRDSAASRRLSGEQLIAKGETTSGLEELARSLEEFEGAGDWRAAESVLNSLLDIDPDNVIYHVKRVEFADRGGQRDARVAAYLGLANALDRNGDRAGTMRVYDHVLSIDPENPVALAASATSRAQNAARSESRTEADAVTESSTEISVSAADERQTTEDPIGAETAGKTALGRQQGTENGISDTTGKPRPVDTPRRPSYAVAVGCHVFFGFGLFYADPQARRKWIYVAVVAYAIVDVLLGPTYGIVRFFEEETGAWSFVIAVIIYVASYADVIVTCKRRRKASSRR